MDLSLRTVAQITETGVFKQPERGDRQTEETEETEREETKRETERERS